MGCVAPVYRPRDAEHTVLHQVIALHLEAFLDAVAEAGDGAGLPQFVEREFREFLLTVPYRLRYQTAWNHGLSRAVLGVYARVLLDVYARGAWH
jgi:hypothetical protein